MFCRPREFSQISRKAPRIGSDDDLARLSGIGHNLQKKNSFGILQPMPNPEVFDKASLILLVNLLILC